jgi:phosphohistidine phosphatase SixA
VPGAHGLLPKVVDYWSMRMTGGEFAPNDEVDGLEWLSPAQAATRVTHQHDAGVLEAFAKLPAVTGTVLLVRHAKAGDQQRWPRDDRARPLEPTGQAQAVWLAELLPWFGPKRVLSADKVRCQQTVEPLAEGLGLTVEVDSRFDEEAYGDDPDLTLEHVRELGADGGVTVVSSQGGLIPGVVGALAKADGTAVDRDPAAQHKDGRLRSRKGSVWVLSFARRRLVQADYFASPRDAA